MQFEEPGEQVVASLRVERRLEQRERVPVPPLRERGEVGTQRALIVLQFFEAEGVTRIGG